jgi:3-isopropylmalate/(R)-2-methylmalate dehydratase large subunit
MKGKKVAPGVRFIITPAPSALSSGREARLVETLVEAGAVVTNATCGACYGGIWAL